MAMKAKKLHPDSLVEGKLYKVQTNMFSTFGYFHRMAITNKKLAIIFLNEDEHSFAVYYKKIILLEEV